MYGAPGPQKFHLFCISMLFYFLFIYLFFQLKEAAILLSEMKPNERLEAWGIWKSVTTVIFHQLMKDHIIVHYDVFDKQLAQSLVTDKDVEAIRTKATQASKAVTCHINKDVQQENKEVKKRSSTVSDNKNSPKTITSHEISNVIESQGQNDELNSSHEEYSSGQPLMQKENITTVIASNNYFLPIKKRDTLEIDANQDSYATSSKSNSKEQVRESKTKHLHIEEKSISEAKPKYQTRKAQPNVNQVNLIIFEDSSRTMEQESKCNFKTLPNGNVKCHLCERVLHNRSNAIGKSA